MVSLTCLRPETKIAAFANSVDLSEVATRSTLFAL